MMLTSIKVIRKCCCLKLVKVILWLKKKRLRLQQLLDRSRFIRRKNTEDFSKHTTTNLNQDTTGSMRRLEKDSDTRGWMTLNSVSRVGQTKKSQLIRLLKALIRLTKLGVWKTLTGETINSSSLIQMNTISTIWSNNFRNKIWSTNKTKNKCRSSWN